MCNLTVWMGVIMLVLWFYIRFTGELREFGAKIDHLGEVVWDEVRSLCYRYEGFMCVLKEIPIKLNVLDNYIFL